MIENKLKILIIDDDKLLLTQASNMVAQVLDADVITENDPRRSLDLLNNNSDFDLVFLDLNMPDVDGIEVMRHMANVNFPGMIVLFSAEDDAVLRTARRLGMERRLRVMGSLTKPVSKPSLKACLEKVMAARAKQEQPGSESVLLESVTKDALLVAVRDDIIVPYFQPKVTSADGTLVAVEALARWPLPDGGIVPPMTFIPPAEKYNLIHDLTLRLYEQCMQQLSVWMHQQLHIGISINISSDSLAIVDLPEVLSQISSYHKVSNKLVTLEITETKLAENLATALDVLARLRLKGFGLSIDDFGTGYSNMINLGQAPFNELKIDRAFVQKADHETSAMAILETSAELARKLDMSRVAEGVETMEQLQLVKSMGVEIVQGYMIAKPMPGDEIVTWHQQWLKQNPLA